MTTTTMIRPSRAVAPGDGARTRRHRPVPPRRPNYAARRVGAVGLLVLVIVLARWSLPPLASVVVGASPASASSPSTDAAGTLRSARHVAQPGDTLWSIAGTYRGEVGRAAYLDALISLNGGTTVQVGQAVLLP